MNARTTFVLSVASSNNMHSSSSSSFSSSSRMVESRPDRFINSLESAEREREDRGHVTRSRGASCLRECCVQSIYYDDVHGAPEKVLTV